MDTERPLPLSESPSRLTLWCPCPGDRCRDPFSSMTCSSGLSSSRRARLGEPRSGAHCGQLWGLVPRAQGHGALRNWNRTGRPGLQPEASPLSLKGLWYVLDKYNDFIEANRIEDSRERLKTLRKLVRKETLAGQRQAGLGEQRGPRRRRVQCHQFPLGPWEALPHSRPQFLHLYWGGGRGGSERVDSRAPEVWQWEPLWGVMDQGGHDSLVPCLFSLLPRSGTSQDTTMKH